MDGTVKNKTPRKRELPVWFQKTTSTGCKDVGSKSKKKDVTLNRVKRTVYCMSPEEFFRYAQNINKQNDAPVEDLTADQKNGLDNAATQRKNDNPAEDHVLDVHKLSKSDVELCVDTPSLESLRRITNSKERVIADSFVPDTKSVIPETPEFSVLDELL